MTQGYEQIQGVIITGGIAFLSNAFEQGDSLCSPLPLSMINSFNTCGGFSQLLLVCHIVPLAFTKEESEVKFRWDVDLSSNRFRLIGSVIFYLSDIEIRMMMMMIKK